MLDISRRMRSIRPGRHVRRRPRRAAIAAVQCASRRIWLSAHRRLRRRGPLRHRRAAARQAAQRHGNPRLAAPPAAGDPGELAQNRDHVARRQPLLLPRGARLVPEQPDRLHPRRRAHHHPARPCPGAGGRHQGAVRGRAGEGQGAPLQGVPRRCRQLEPGGAHHRPLRDGRTGHRHPLSSSRRRKAIPARCTRRATAAWDRPKTTSNHGKPIWPPTGPPARRRRPTSSGCSCTPELIG